MLKLFLLNLIVLFSIVWAADKPNVNMIPSSPEPLNHVLFSESNTSWTARDFELFLEIKKIVLHVERISSFVENSREDFLLTRLASREAKVFEVEKEHFKNISDDQRRLLSKYSESDIQAELLVLSSAKTLIELKESQLKQKLRFRSWFDLIKRKYQVKLKSPEMRM